MQFNPRNVIILLFTAATFNLPQTPVTNEEMEVKEKIENMLQKMYEDKYEIEEEDSLDFENSFDIPETEPVAEKEENENEITYVKEMICVNDDIPIEYKRNAVEFWKPVNSIKTKPLESVKHRFRKVTSLRQLRRWQEQVNRGGTRLQKLKEIASYTLEKFKEGLEKGVIIHDTDITRWALKAQQEINAPGFTASIGWVKRFKLAHNIVSRKITKFVTKKTLQSKKI
ncbi:uncharacterized protein LOC113562649 [Ooceraea biroi]|uniref:uncharacterized protein LOC113562649 n=1 Tax=Ooceraea biroi TaxID=2015173 RepID=UPI000F07E8E8|nr:uncharacterized protein LOC113562649 [Ooceraea biroi]